MTIRAKIKNSHAEEYYISITDKDKYGRLIQLVGGIWGDDYNVVSGIISNYQITVKKNGEMIAQIDVDDYTCLTWKEPGA